MMGHARGEVERDSPDRYIHQLMFLTGRQYSSNHMIKKMMMMNKIA